MNRDNIETAIAYLEEEFFVHVIKHCDKNNHDDIVRGFDELSTSVENNGSKEWETVCEIYIACEYVEPLYGGDVNDRKFKDCCWFSYEGHFYNPVKPWAVWIRE